jgi:hypothetical protein
MDAGITILLTLAFGLILFIIQRSEARRRFLVFIISLIVVELLRRYVWFRDVHAEAWTAFIIALLLNAFFWLFIGRYNPPGSSDDIQVIGMDD